MNVTRRDVIRGLAVLGTGAVPVRALFAGAASAAEPRRFDLHHHYVTPEWMAVLDAENKLRPISGIETFHGWSAPKAIAAMDQGGVERPIRSTTTPGLWFGDPAQTRRLARGMNDYGESGTATKYPNIRFIFSHAGGTIPILAGRYFRAQATAQALAAPAAPDSKLDHLRRFYYDTAGSANPVQMQALKMIVPPTQIVFGTDFPWGTPAEIATGLAGSGLTDAELAGIDRGNALRLLPQYRA